MLERSQLSAKVGDFEKKIWAFSEYMNFNRSFVIISLLYINYFTFNLEKKFGPIVPN